MSDNGAKYNTATLDDSTLKTSLNGHSTIPSINTRLNNDAKSSDEKKATKTKTTKDIPHQSIDHLNHFHTKDLKVAPHFRRITRDSAALKLGLSSPSDNLSPCSQRLMYDHRIKKVKPKSLKDILMKPFEVSSVGSVKDTNCFSTSSDVLGVVGSQSKLHDDFSSDSINCDIEEGEEDNDESPEQLMMNTHSPSVDSPIAHMKHSK